MFQARFHEHPQARREALSTEPFGTGERGPFSFTQPTVPAGPHSDAKPSICELQPEWAKIEDWLGHLYEEPVRFCADNPEPGPVGSVHGRQCSLSSLSSRRRLNGGDANVTHARGARLRHAPRHAVSPRHDHVGGHRASTGSTGAG